MPGQNGRWLHHCQTLPPAIPEAREQRPEDTIDRTKPGAMPLVNQARKLVAQCNILGDEIRTISEYGGNNAENEWEFERHRADHRLSRNHREKSANAPQNPIMLRHRLAGIIAWRLRRLKRRGGTLL
jgi:hypothetical protein